MSYHKISRPKDMTGSPDPVKTIIRKIKHSHWPFSLQTFIYLPARQDSHSLYYFMGAGGTYGAQTGNFSAGGTDLGGCYHINIFQILIIYIDTPDIYSVN